MTQTHPERRTPGRLEAVAEPPAEPSSPPPEDWRDQAEAIRELDRIAQIRSGFDFSVPAWVIESSAPVRSWALPSSFDLDSLSGEELRVGVTLGILTLEVLTADQRLRLDSAYRNSKLPSGTAQGLLSRLASAPDEFSPKPRVRSRKRQRLN